MSLYDNTNPPGFGIAPRTVSGTFTNRAGVSGSFGSKGVLTMLDLLASDAATTSGVPGNEAGIFANVVAVSAAALDGLAPFIPVVAKESCADDAEFEGVIHGIVDGLVIAASGSVAVGSELVAAVGGHLDLVQASGELVIGIGLEAVTTPTSATLGNVFLMGTHYGTFATTAYS